MLASTADTLAACGEALSAGDVVITGSVVPPIDVSGGGPGTSPLPALGEIAVTIAAS